MQYFYHLMRIESDHWLQEREDFDDLLLKHATSKGAKVFMETRISEIDMNSTPYSAKWTSKTAGSGRITFDYIIDCSGREGILSTKVFRNRNHNKALKNIATWGYWTGDISLYGTGTTRQSAQWLEGLATGAPGWIWFIPLRDGKVSVGVVMKESDNIALRKESTSLKDHYLRALARAPCAMKMVEKGQLLEGVRTASDYSYSAETYAGHNWRLAGDAGAFIDPFFSSGVHLALNGGLSAAVSVLASIRGHVSEDQAAAYHSKKSQIGYTR
jgi:flavine halogenase